MIVAKGRCNCAWSLALVIVAVVVALLANRATAAVATYNFDVNGAVTGFGVTPGSTYDWDDATNGGFWSDNASSTTGNIATNGWVQGSVAQFQSAGFALTTYTVTVSNEKQIAGLTATGGTPTSSVNINAIGGGALNLPSGLHSFLGGSGTGLWINAPITGSGGIQASNGGGLFLNGANTYSGGTNLATPSTLVHFNNSSSFGTNFINIAGTDANIAGSGGATITLPNNFTTSARAAIEFLDDLNTPVVSTGNWSMGVNDLRVANDLVGNVGSVAPPLTLSGVISGSGNLVFNSNDSGTIILSGINTYTGTTRVGTFVPIYATPMTLRLGARNTIASSSSVILSTCVLNPGGFDQIMNHTTLGLIGDSTIDYGAGASELDFANSSSLSWQGTLNLLNWDPSIDKLRFGIDATGLTSAQLAEITLNGKAGTARLDSSGYVVPEPSSSLVLLGASLLLIRRRAAR